MGRPKIFQEPRIATAIRLPVSLRTRLAAAAAREGRSVNLVVTAAIADYLARLPQGAVAEDSPPSPTATAGPRR